MPSNKKTKLTAVKGENIGTLFNFVIRSKDIVQINEVITQNSPGFIQSENKKDL